MADGVATVGTGASCDLRLEGDPYVSTLHATISRHHGHIWVEDMGSTNGTYISGPLSIGWARITGPQVVHPGHRVRFGRTILTFNADGQVDVAPYVPSA